MRKPKRKRDDGVLVSEDMYETITIVISREQRDELERMVSSGYWGENVERTAEELLRIAMRKEMKG
jgi:hypothetical protein